MLKFILIFTLCSFAAQDTIRIHPANDEVIVKGTWLFPTRCVNDTEFVIAKGDTLFFQWILRSNNSGGYVDFKGKQDTLVVSKDTIIKH